MFFQFRTAIKKLGPKLFLSTMGTVVSGGLVVAVYSFAEPKPLDADEIYWEAMHHFENSASCVRSTKPRTPRGI